MGIVSTSSSGRPCQSWSSQEPHHHGVTSHVLPDRTLQEAGSYCRNPGGQEVKPWCYTQDPHVRMEYCQIPVCGQFTCYQYLKSSTQTSVCIIVLLFYYVLAVLINLYFNNTFLKMRSKFATKKRNEELVEYKSTKPPECVDIILCTS